MAVKLKALGLATSLLCFVMLLGCGADSNESSESTTAGTETTDTLESGSVESNATDSNMADSNMADSNQSEDQATVEPIKMTPVSKAELDERVGELKGKVVLVDFWATWCGPCMKKFPDVIKLSKTHQSDGLHVMSICIGNPSDSKTTERAVEFLEKVGADIENRIGAYEKDMEAFEEFDLTQVPNYRLYDREGNLVGVYEFLNDQAMEKLAELLAN